MDILYEKNVTGSTTTITKHFYADGLQVAKMVGTGTYYLHEDALGSVRLETTTTVTVKFSSDYVPYGSNYGMTGKEVFMYIGQPYSSVTELYYLGARYYDTTIGRFITEDSYEGDESDPMSLNRYVYGRDNPEKYSDTNGHRYDFIGGSGIPGTVWTQQSVQTVTTQSVSSSSPSTTTSSTGQTTTTISWTTTTTTECAVTGSECFPIYSTSSKTQSSTSVTTTSSARAKAQGEATLLVLYAVTIGGAVVFWPTLVLTVPGSVTATIYYVDTNQPTMNGVLNAYLQGVEGASEILRDLAIPIIVVLV